MTAEQLAERLLRRFKSVPDYRLEDALEAVEDVMSEEGYEPSDDVPSDDVKVSLRRALISPSSTISLSVAKYFKVTDGDQSLVQSKVSPNYRTPTLAMPGLLAKIEFKTTTGFAIMPVAA